MIDQAHQPQASELFSVKHGRVTVLFVGTGMPGSALPKVRPGILAGDHGLQWPSATVGKPRGQVCLGFQPNTARGF